MNSFLCNPWIMIQLPLIMIIYYFYRYYETVIIPPLSSSSMEVSPLSHYCARIFILNARFARSSMKIKYLFCSCNPVHWAPNPNPVHWIAVSILERKMSCPLNWIFFKLKPFLALNFLKLYLEFFKSLPRSSNIGVALWKFEQSLLEFTF